MEMKKVLKVILIRSGILLSLLVVLIMAIKTMVQEGPLEPPKQEKILAILRTEMTEEYDLHLRGIKDGVVYNGLQYSTKIYASPSLIRDADLVYIMGPCEAEEFLRQRGENLSLTVVGYAYIQEPSANYTGVYSGLDWQKVLPIYQKIIPAMRRLGVIYTQGSCDGERQVLSLKDLAALRPNLTIVDQPIDRYGADIDTILFELFEQVDAIYAVSRDTVIENHLKRIAELCLQKRIPLIGGGIFGPQKGTLASMAFDPYRVGRTAADVIRTLERADNPSKVEIARIEPELYINLRTAYHLGLDIPSDLRKIAKKVYN